MAEYLFISQMITFKYDHITKEEVEDMRLQIAAHAGKTEAKRFERVSFELQQKITLCLRNRMKRLKSSELDYFTIREVIDDARKGLFIDYEILKHI